MQAMPSLLQSVIIAPEAIHQMRFVRLNPRSSEFQCALVAVQTAIEEALRRFEAQSSVKLIVTHRGTLDPCAFWVSFGNTRDSFLTMTGTSVEAHYARYAAVIHLESAAVRVPDAYERYPQAHRPETREEAKHLDRILAELWGAHPNYIRIEGCSAFLDKMDRAQKLILDLV
jgi:hypothetical protein